MTKTEEKLATANRLYLFISQINQLIVRATDEKTVFAEVCKIAVNTGQFKMAWIGLLDEATKVLKPVTHFGDDQNYLSVIKIIANTNVPEGRGPAGISLENGIVEYSNDIATDPRMEPWREEALKRGFRASISLPIKSSEKVTGTFILYAGTPNFFNPEEIRILENATADISFALDIFKRDIQRKEAEGALLKVLQRYHTLTEISPVGIFHTDPKGFTNYVNPKWCEISGISFDEALGNGWLTSVHEEDKHLLSKGWTEATKNQETSVSEYRFVRPDGTIVWVIGQATPERNQQNEIIGYVGTTTDITDHKNAEMALAHAYKEKQTILNRIDDAMVSLDSNWRYTFLNDAALSTHPIGREKTIGKTIWEVHPEILGTQFDRKIREAMHTKKAQEIEAYYASGHTWFSAKVYPSDDGLTIFYTDITQRKKIESEILREQQLSDSIINSLPGIFYLYTNEGVFLKWNKNFETVSKYEDSEIKNMHPLDFFDDTEKELLNQKITNTFLHGVDDVQANFITKTKEKIPYYFTGIAIEYKGSQCLMGVGIDFSERIRIQEEIKRTSTQLHELTAHLQGIREEERKRIGREIHDELGQQLTAIKMDIAWINKRLALAEPVIKDKLSNVVQLLDGSNRSIRRILSELRPAILDDHGLLDAILWHNRQFKESTGISVKLVTDKAEIKVDEKTSICIFRIYQEAFTNIMRHAHANKVVTSIHVTADAISVSIEDDGKGFDSSSTEKTFGLLGMRERIYALNGTFEISSVIGKGTTVSIRLPLLTE